MRSLEAKVVVLGAQGVGKTSVVIRYVGSVFSPCVSPTIGASFFTCKLNLNDYRIRLQVWDTAGQERFRSMAPMYYRKANAALLVFDLTSEESFNEVKSWVDELKRNVEEAIVMCLLGNKADLESERAISTEDASEYAERIGAKYFETSAMANQGIEDVFVQCSLGLIDLSQQQINTNLRFYQCVDEFSPPASPPVGDSRLRVGPARRTPSPQKSSRECC